MKTYSTSEFAKKAHVSIRTVRYYSNIGLLNARLGEDEHYYYTEDDFFRLQKILSLKYFGFSLKEIEQFIGNNSTDEVKQLFDMQIKLVRKKIENLKQVEKGLIDANKIIESNGTLKWTDVINLLHLLNMEEQLLEQYRNSENLAIRIRLHADYSHNTEGWFPWLLKQIAIEEQQNILEIGCGNGELWKSADIDELSKTQITLSDISSGMIQDAMNNLKDGHFEYAVFDCSEAPYEDNEFDKVIANHMLFYVKDIAGALYEVCRILKPEGEFYCSTYGKNHMKEISDLAKAFDERINLSEIELFKIFGLENGESILREHFEEVSLRRYEDYLDVDDIELLCEYIYSCHGNQNEILIGRKEEFKNFLLKEMRKGKLRISKDAGVFVCRRPKV